MSPEVAAAASGIAVAVALALVLAVGLGGVVVAAHRRFEQLRRRRQEESRARLKMLRADIEELRCECWEGVREILAVGFPVLPGHAWQPPADASGWPSLASDDELELVHLESGTVRGRVYKVEHPDGRTWWVAYTLNAHGRAMQARRGDPYPPAGQTVTGPTEIDAVRELHRVVLRRLGLEDERGGG